MTPGADIDISFRGRLGGFELEAAFTAPARGVTGLFGPSGCGKTTILRGIAGLQKFVHGRCVVAGEAWQTGDRFTPPHARAVGYVFQEASLFPHLSVRGNLLYGAPRGTDDAPFDEIVEWLGLGGWLDRRPSHLSGGERQRVAMGRALMSRPKILLMDEPLSALDAQARQEILPFLDRLRRSLDIPVIYVSHDRAEVERLADRIVLMAPGRVVSVDPTPPRSVALRAVVASVDAGYGQVRVDVDGASLLSRALNAAIGEVRTLTIRAEDVSVAGQAPGRSSIANILPARVIRVVEHGAFDVIVELGLGPRGDGARVLADCTKHAWEALRLDAGADVFAQVRAARLDPA